MPAGRTPCILHQYHWEKNGSRWIEVGRGGIGCDTGKGVGLRCNRWPYIRVTRMHYTRCNPLIHAIADVCMFADSDRENACGVAFLLNCSAVSRLSMIASSCTSPDVRRLHERKVEKKLADGARGTGRVHLRKTRKR